MHGTRDNKSTLYMVPVTPEKNEDMTECKIPECQFDDSLYKAKTKADLSTFLHLACSVHDVLVGSCVDDVYFFIIKKALSIRCHRT